MTTKTITTTKNGTPYTVAAERFIVNNYGKMKLTSIANRLRRSTEAVRRKARRLGVAQTI